MTTQTTDIHMFKIGMMPVKHDCQSTPRYVIKGPDEEYDKWVHNHMYKPVLFDTTKLILQEKYDKITPPQGEKKESIQAFWKGFGDTVQEHISAIKGKINWKAKDSTIRRRLYTEFGEDLPLFFMKHMCFMIVQQVVAQKKDNNGELPTSFKFSKYMSPFLIKKILETEGKKILEADIKTIFEVEAK